ncbi:MAG TPA: hypothetical protein VL360_06125 [Gammaproteobacteria bacterium]|jgi:hypothetical protein|nr:hypothetical protein [Gammaproteobacteria bacterium]
MRRLPGGKLFSVSIQQTEWSNTMKHSYINHQQHGANIKASFANFFSSTSSLERVERIVNLSSYSNDTHNVVYRKT